MLFCAADPATQVASELAALALSTEKLNVVNRDATTANNASREICLVSSAFNWYSVSFSHLPVVKPPLFRDWVSVRG